MRTSILTTTSVAALFAASTVADALAQHTVRQPNAGGVVSASPDYSKSMQELQRAAQRLRETIQALAQQPVGPSREQALKSAREALYDTQVAMIRLPPELRQAQPGVGATGAAPGYDQALARLKQASDRLYNALHAMAKEPAGPRRNNAIDEAREALLETETALGWAYTARAGDKRSAAPMSHSTASTQASGTADADAGGVGIDARAMLAQQADPDHNVKMVFALNTGNYLADVHVRVADSSGRTVIEGTSDGPWLYAKLPPGAYNASATYAGHTVTERFTVRRSGDVTAQFRWPAHVEQQAVGATAAEGGGQILGTGPQEPMHR